ncbi:DUF4307 domain-containing protein [Microbacterium halophytorum]|uniref:DUF4307 domain-containing protein n=1 Tax=Microbacterium halophytorum TaxID=2067568 RepID=UPI001E2EA46B|nr:DUF4307 domain-containing protein [Microbacterium halophytorum]
MTTTQQMLDDRYGRTRRRGRIRAAWITVVVVAAAVVGYFAWNTVTTSADSVKADDLGFTVVDESTTRVAFQFTAPAETDVACVVEALDEEFGTVGWKVFEYRSEERMPHRQEELVPTIAEATTGLVKSCWVL